MSNEELPHYPSSDEIEAWATKEKARRQGYPEYIKGPNEQDRKDWAVRELMRKEKEEKEQVIKGRPLYPTQEDIKGYVEKEKRERNEWAQGPTAKEKEAWAREEQARGAKKDEAAKQRPYYPGNDEIEAWAKKERDRRKKYSNGPDVEEKEAWALREHARREAAAPSEEDYTKDEALQIYKDAEKRRRDMVLAAQGLVSSVLLWVTGADRPLTLDGELSASKLHPFVLWERLIRAGKRREDDERVRNRIADD